MTGLVTNLLCFPVLANALTIDEIVHPVCMYYSRWQDFYKRNRWGWKENGRILEVFTNGDKKVIASGLNDPKGLLAEEYNLRYRCGRNKESLI